MELLLCYISAVVANVLANLLLFRLDALALSVIATATWLAGWLVAGWLSHSGTVLTRLNLSEKFFDRLKAPSF